MENNTKNLKRTLKKAKNICVITHIGSDIDAVCSLLLMHRILSEYFKKKNVGLFVQEVAWPRYENLNLENLNLIKNIGIKNSLITLGYDTVIIVDSPTAKHSVRSNEPLDKLFKRVIIFDHHNMRSEYPAKLTFNSPCSSTVEQIYRTFKEITPGIKKDPSAALYIQAGIIADTGRFLYQNLLSEKTFDIMAEAYKIKPVDIERIHYKSKENTRDSIKIFTHILQNLAFKDDMAYAFIDPDFIEKNDYTYTDTDAASSFFSNFYLRTIENVNWGFIVRKESRANTWRVSLRAISGTTPVNKFAEQLGGGGHIYAAGAVFEANTVGDAVKIVYNTVMTQPPNNSGAQPSKTAAQQ